MAAPSTFSYAQAAKGQGAAPTNSSTNPTSQPQDPQASVAEEQTASPDVDQANPAPVSAAVPDVADSTDASSAAPEKQQDIESIPGSSESDARSESVQERPSDSKRDDEVSRLDRPWRRNDRATRSSSTTTRSADDQDSRKARRSKKGKAAEKPSPDQAAAATDKEPEAEPEAPKIELSEAPIPSVNIWHQRKEAHAAKSKPTTNGPEETSNASSMPSEENKPLAKPTEEVAPSATPRDVPYTNGIKPQRKSADPPRPERNGPRGSRLGEKDTREGVKAYVPPPVEDATAWPTPETAIKEEKKDEKRKTGDKTNLSDKDAQEDSSSKQSKQKWVTYDYVPTVNFETQLPQIRSSKPRGGARAGRDGGARPTAGGVADKTAATAPSNKSNESRDRPRETNGSNRATSLPPAAKRGSVDAANGREQKKVSAHAGADKTKDATAPSLVSYIAHSGSRLFECLPHSSSYAFYGDLANCQFQENGHASRTEGRGERGRGSYRGRGSHHAVNSQAQHQHSASAVGAQGFGGPGSGPSRGQGPYPSPPRQSGHGSMFMPPTRGGRGRNGANGFNHRMSLPNGAARIPAVQTQFSPYDYPVAPMAAVPFQPHPYWDNVFMAMLRGQIEYYFSIENLCKDMYLRARMDSQGFVPLHFIAAFKRVRDLSLDLGLVRAVCEESVEVDFVIGEDDIERLRRREDWQKFVLPMADRDELARTHGPAQLTYKNRSYTYGQHFNGMPSMPYGVSSPPAYPVNPNDGSFQHYPEGNHVDYSVNGGTNGVINGHVNGNGTSQLSAEVADFSPSGSTILAGLDTTETLKAAMHSGKASKAEDAVAAPESTNGHVDTPLTNGITNGVHAEEPVQSVEYFVGLTVKGQGEFASPVSNSGDSHGVADPRLRERQEPKALYQLRRQFLVCDFKMVYWGFEGFCSRLCVQNGPGVVDRKGCAAFGIGPKYRAGGVFRDWLSRCSETRASRCNEGLCDYGHARSDNGEETRRREGGWLEAIDSDSALPCSA
ncbi:hypothetical protein G7046_g6259 [Stylonectria norvegica]|nr:hypothetical protein G7046_g6259 [Stylonectria norvegica]